MRTIMAVALLVGGVPACERHRPSPVEAPFAEGANAGPASLWRRVAEAVDGFRDGKDKWVVIDTKHPHMVAGVFSSQAEADSARAQAIASTGGSFERFGPFTTIEDPPFEGDKDPVDSVVVYRRSGQRDPYDGAKYDAVFWSLPAFDKFIAPYLTSVSGVRYAAEQRELYRQGKSPLVHSTAVAHYRSSF